MHAPWTKGELKIDRIIIRVLKQHVPGLRLMTGKVNCNQFWVADEVSHKSLRHRAGYKLMNEVDWKGKRQDKTLTGTKQRTAQFTETSD